MFRIFVSECNARAAGLNVYSGRWLLGSHQANWRFQGRGLGSHGALEFRGLGVSGSRGSGV